MSEEEPEASPDSWKRVVDFAIGLLRHNGAEHDAGMVIDRRDALLAVEDEHPPVFHVRPRQVAKPMEVTTTTGAVVEMTVPQTEWDWVAVAANGNKLYGSTESYENKSHALEQAHSVADALGAEVKVEGEDGE